MKKICYLLLALLLLPLGLSDASARAGSGISAGSRGGRTFSSPSYSPSYSAAPITRSTTAQPSTPSPSYAPSPGIAPGYSPGYSGGGFWHGIAGGFVGAGLAHMLFGGGYGGGMGGGYGGGGGGGGFLPLLLIAGIVYLFVRRRRTGGGIAAPFDTGFAPTVMPMATPTARPVNAEQPLSISQGDQSAFGDILQNVQRCWSAGDLTALRQFATPEMVQYFSEQLSANASRGLVNKVEQVTLDQAELLESWSEYGLDYATARLSWHAFDTMVPLGQTNSGAELTQSRSEPAQEIWTFVRSAGGHWLLSAIQQTH